MSPSVSATLVETRKLCIGVGRAWRADRSAQFFSWSIALYGQFVPYLRYAVLCLCKSLTEQKQKGSLLSSTVLDWEYIARWLCRYAVTVTTSDNISSNK